MTPTRPPRLADWILKRVLSIGKRGDSILGRAHHVLYSLDPDHWYRPRGDRMLTALE